MIGNSGRIMDRYSATLHALRDAVAEHIAVYEQLWGSLSYLEDMNATAMQLDAAIRDYEASKR